jgi:hypothetical protein
MEKSSMCRSQKEERARLRFRDMIALAILLLVSLVGCSRTPSNTYPPLEATLNVLAQREGMALRYPVWASSGMVYYMAYPEDTGSTELTQLNPATGVKRVIAEGILGPLAVAEDGKIAALEMRYRIIVYDSTGIEVWAMNVGDSISSIAFSSNSNELYYCKNGDLLLIAIGGSSPHDTVLKQIAEFSKSPDDSIFIYRTVTAANGDFLHTFYKYDSYTGETTRILQEGFSAGFALSPVSMDVLAVGAAGANSEQELARQILLYHIDHGIGRIFESSPYPDCYLYVESWEPEGNELLITVTPFLPGDPIIPLPSEIWTAQDIY